jgi:peptide/nickel transport system permease protein
MLGLRRIAQRLVQTLFVLWVVATILFLLFRLMPGSPLAAYIDPTFTAEQQELLLSSFGLDRPLHEQYLLFLGNLLQGELGQSFFYKRPVGEVIMSAFPNTIALTLGALIVAYAFGVIAGALMAWKRGTWIEGVGIPAVLATRAAPEFWLGMLLLAVFSFGLGWLPGGGANAAGTTYDSEWARMFSLDFLRHLILPAFALALYLQGLPLLLMRTNMLDVMQEDFITMARMKGLSTWGIVIRHAARNALLPVATAFALGLGQSVGGNVVVETVFSWPGLGRMLVDAVASSDYPLAQGAFLLITAVLVTMNLVADLLYTVLDPRVSHARR